MNGSTSPDPLTAEAYASVSSGRDEIAVAKPNGVRSPDNNAHVAAKRLKSSPPRPASSGKGASPRLKDASPRDQRPVADGDDDAAGESEAETLIDSPVKKKQEAEKQNNAPKADRPLKHRIGSLPVPSGNDDEDDSANVSPAPSTSVSVEQTTLTREAKDEDMKDDSDKDADGESDTGSLSDPDSEASDAPSQRSLNSRAASERPDYNRHDAHSPNPRKRKHRASSVSLPNKRPSLNTPKRRLRGLHSEEVGRSEQSLSPKLRSHRRAVSTQSAFMDGSIEGGANRKRRAGTQGPVKESKLIKGWEEESVSSETTSHGHDPQRPRRGIGRSTSTPGRPAGRKPKPHVNKYGFTRLAEACEANDLDLVKEWREKDPDQLELAEFAGNKPLQIAALNGNVEVVDYLIDQGCQIDCANVDKDTPLIDAAENGHLDVVNSLLRAGVDPLRQNLKGQQALDVVTDDTDDADEIRAALRQAIDKWNSTGAKQKREEEEEMRHRAGPSKELHFMARTYENLLRLVQINDRTGVREFLDARVMVDNNVVAAAAKTGDTYLVNMLLAEMTEKKALQKPEKPLLSVLGTSHTEMVRSLTELDNFNPLWRNRQGKTWPEIAEERHGPNWREEKELLDRLYDQSAATKERRSSSPVTKRDSGKRRFAHRAPDEEEDSDEQEQAPRRKNGRKLMSKKDLRAARGQAASDESSYESSSEIPTPAEPVEEVSMKPPESPATKRTPTRSRTKSFSAQPTELPSPRTRRRSSSFRGMIEQPLSTVEENMEDKAAAEKQRQDEDRRAAEVAQELELKRKQEEAAAAEVAARRAAEEKARQAEEDRMAEEARREEEMRQAEEARIADEERTRQLAEQQRRDKSKDKHRADILAGLPKAISYVLDPRTDFDIESKRGKSHIWRYFTRIQVLSEEEYDPLAECSDTNIPTYWVPNVLVAPLLGPAGIELFVHGDHESFADSLAGKWLTKDFPMKRLPLLKTFMDILPPPGFEIQPTFDETGRSLLSKQEQAQRTRSLLEGVAAAKRALTAGPASLRYVRLEDVLANIHPSLNGYKVDIRFDHLPLSIRPPPAKDGFPGGIGREPQARTFTVGSTPNVSEFLCRPIRRKRDPANMTDVRVVHEK
ncbi:hypothetical protein CLAFUW4_01793 [Fulvia fulva]|uniref:Ankyrin repeat protein n=1 Tax=Passalora fulva TaxID=5499 RepID=A0A9Q8P2S5_PASFU|nr:uncharacterized protein CLAFUR5_01789 [Fulvia fulva]KAK4634345.1 hypothetical protein CLAFUR4_01791 [Fulvia fulva]KAK4638201.1 hypothetical protein CLAFUR0_01793 [Fulvia fulva]UJO11250.1 hypothetical protein CLAFUR5_01789 [Fulvia fulva]WPV10116.1 hypothetical protein CLAFUW4_01793 [Fulvia fulva]WPV24696.1 hypothetical protein CLAFUW7_01794 [Fulvia fulva]